MASFAVHSSQAPALAPHCLGARFVRPKLVESRPHHAQAHERAAAACSTSSSSGMSTSSGMSNSGCSGSGLWSRHSPGGVAAPSRHAMPPLVSPLHRHHHHHHRRWQRSSPSGAPGPPQAASPSLAVSGGGPPQPLAMLRPNQYDDEIWGVALPALATMLLEPFISVINTGLIGHLGTQQLGAVSLASIVVSFAGFVFSFLIFLTTPEIAAAHVKGDKAEVSRIGAKSLWLAVSLGLFNTMALLLLGDHIIAIIGPPEPLVRQYATEYLGMRAWGLLLVMVGFVATGTYRGFKDTHTPLYAALGSALCSLVLTYLFLHVFGWGVKGGALAVVLSQGVSASVLWGLLIRKKVLRWKDVTRPPSLASVMPMLRKGLVLAVRNIISFGMVLFASTLCVRAGSAYQASFEVIRQIWMLVIQSFECLNVATQALCAAYLGANNREAAMAILTRVTQLGVMVGAAAGVVVFLLQQPLVNFFSTDALVVSQVMLALPMLCVLFPLDAASSIMDGSLLAAKQTDYMSVVQIVGSVVQYFVLITIASNNLVSSLSIWGVLKILTVFRVVGGVARNWFSPHSAYLEDAGDARKRASTAMAAGALSAPPSQASASAPGSADTSAATAAVPAAATTSTARKAEADGAVVEGHLSHSAGRHSGSTSDLTVLASSSSSSSSTSSPAHASHSSANTAPAAGAAWQEQGGSGNGSNGAVLNSAELQEVSQEAAAEMAEDCMVADCMAGRVMARSAAKDSELVEKRLRCRHPELDCAAQGKAPAAASHAEADGDRAGAGASEPVPVRG